MRAAMVILVLEISQVKENQDRGGCCGDILIWFDTGRVSGRVGQGAREGGEIFLLC